MRGIAVLAAVFYHAKIPGFQGGFLGVDVFFVISGFLITSLVAAQIRAEEFSFIEFYYRRAKRLLPSAFTVIAICLAVSVYVLTEREVRDFFVQVVAALSFSANVALWLQTGYFEAAAETKPLLHFWSLAIEEQYYFLLPLALTLIRQRYWFVAFALGTLGSLVLCIAFVGSKPGAVFYLLPSRAWELGFGSLLALGTMSVGFEKARSALPNALSWFALLILVFLFLRPLSKTHPALDAVLVCIATAVLLTKPPQFLGSGWIGNSLAKIGDMSYSLYLVHWPIFAFLSAANVSGAGLQWPLRIFSLIASFFVAYLLYIGVERRFRTPVALAQASDRVKGLLTYAIVACSIGALAWATNFTGRSEENFAHRLRGNVGLHELCAREGAFKPLDECATSTSPEIILWGDSYAMHWAEGFARGAIGFRQITRPTCAPVLHVALHDSQKSTSWGEECIEFNNAAFDEIARSTAKVVVLSALWGYLHQGQHTFSLNGSTELRSSSAEDFHLKISHTISELRKRDKRVIILMPPPAIGFDIGRCHERLLTNKIFFGATADCALPRSKVDVRQALQSKIMRQVGAANNVAIISFDRELCDEKVCRTTIDEAVLYRDTGHLSYEGSVALVNKSALVEIILNEAK